MRLLPFAAAALVVLDERVLELAVLPASDETPVPEERNPPVIRRRPRRSLLGWQRWHGPPTECRNRIAQLLYQQILIATNSIALTSG